MIERGALNPPERISLSEFFFANEPEVHLTKLDPLRARARVGACFSPPARERHVRRAVVGIRRNMMRVDAAATAKLRTHGDVEGAPQLCESLHSYGRTALRHAGWWRGMRRGAGRRAPG